MIDRTQPPTAEQLREDEITTFVLAGLAIDLRLALSLRDAKLITQKIVTIDAVTRRDPDFLVRFKAAQVNVIKQFESQFLTPEARQASAMAKRPSLVVPECRHRWKSVETNSPMSPTERTTVCKLCGMEYPSGE